MNHIVPRNYYSTAPISAGAGMETRRGCRAVSGKSPKEGRKEKKKGRRRRGKKKRRFGFGILLNFGSSVLCEGAEGRSARLLWWILPCSINVGGASRNN